MGQIYVTDFAWCLQNNNIHCSVSLFVLFDRLCDSIEHHISHFRISIDDSFEMCTQIKKTTNKINTINQLMQYSATRFEHSNGNHRNSIEQWISSRHIVVLVVVVIFQLKLHWVYLIQTCTALYCNHCEMTSIREQNNTTPHSLYLIFFLHVKPKPTKNERKMKFNYKKNSLQLVCVVLFLCWNVP